MGAACTRDAAAHVAPSSPSSSSRHKRPLPSSSSTPSIPLPVLLTQAHQRLHVYHHIATHECLLIPASEHAALGPGWVRLPFSSSSPPPLNPPTHPPAGATSLLPHPPLPPPPPPPTTKGFKCRVCEREVPTKALLHEHLATCLLVADAREQTRGSDEGLRVLMGELRRLLEEQMKVMLHTGKWVGGWVGGWVDE